MAPQAIGPARTRIWRRLLEERFTSIDLVVVLAALAVTGFIGALSGAALVR